MSETKRQAVLIGVMLVLLAAVAGWCGLEMLDQQGRAQRAADALAEASAIADRVDRLRTQDAVASTAGNTQAQEEDLARRIREAANKAGLTGKWEQGIDPKRPRRVGDSPYLRKPTVLFTQDLSLGQIATLLHHLTYDSPLSVTELNLKTPRGGDPGNRWDADITLTYLIYEPQDSSRPGN